MREAKLPERLTEVQPGDRIEVDGNMADVKGILHNEREKQWDLLTSEGRLPEKEYLREQEAQDTE